MAGLVINKSGTSFPVWSKQSRNVKIGEIYNNESFVFIHANGVIYSIYFRDGNGNLVYGDAWDHDVNGNRLPSGWATSILEYPYGTATINNKSYKTFKMRRNEYVLYPSGDRWGSVAAGCRVATNLDTVGQTNKDHLLINYVESSKGGWVQVSDKYGFVDVGLNHGSMPNDISLYGN